MAKSPRPGRVKTRLCPPCTPQEAAEVATAALADTLDAVAACGAARKVLALDGEPGPWLPPGFEVVPQRGGALDERLTNAWADTGGPGLQIGMDTPQVTAEELDALLALLTAPPPTDDCRATALLGPAADGGWWVIGLPGTDPHLVFPRVPMSTAATGRAQADRLWSMGLAVLEAPVRRDIDTVEDLRAVAASIPCSRTAVAAREQVLA